MAEKRAKDRVVLKLIDAHGLLYSDVDVADLDDSDRKPKAQVREAYSDIQDKVDKADTVDALNALYKETRQTIATLPRDWEEEIVQRFADRKARIQSGASNGAQEVDQRSDFDRFSDKVKGLKGADAKRDFWEQKSTQAAIASWPQNLKDEAQGLVEDLIEDDLQKVAAE